jgi:proteasome lid subunit RPN8/RPN11
MHFCEKPGATKKLMRFTRGNMQGLSRAPETKEEAQMIYLQLREYEKLLEHALQCLPEEACGLIGGSQDDLGNSYIEKVYLLENTDHSEEHFSLDPGGQLAAVKEMRANGWKPLGNWHNHPASPSRPSEEDIRLAYDSSALYLILSLMERGAPVLNAFRIEGGHVEKKEIRYIQG